MFIVTPLGGDRVFLQCSNGKFLIMLCMRSCLQILKIGRHQMRGRSVVHGFVFMGCPFMHGMLIFSCYVCLVWEGLFMRMSVRLIRPG